MKTFKTRFTPEVSRLVSKLHPENKKVIRQALHELRQKPYDGNPLQGELSGLWSLKAKRYRVLYRISEEANYIDVLYIGHRRDVYEQFRSLMAKLQQTVP
jgi:addiction module RelE/StbE family toxin